MKWKGTFGDMLSNSLLKGASAGAVTKADLQAAAPNLPPLMKAVSLTPDTIISVLAAHVDRAVADLPESPTGRWGSPINTAIGFGKKLSIPIVRDMSVRASHGHVSAMVDELVLTLPLTVDNCLTGDIEYLDDLHRFLHGKDMMAWNSQAVKIQTEYSHTRMSHLVAISYRDAFLGTMCWSTATGDSIEELLSDYGRASYLVLQAVKALQNEREITFANLLAAIDTAWETHCNEQPSD